MGKKKKKTYPVKIKDGVLTVKGLESAVPIGMNPPWKSGYSPSK